MSHGAALSGGGGGADGLGSILHDEIKDKLAQARLEAFQLQVGGLCCRPPAAEGAPSIADGKKPAEPQRLQTHPRCRTHTGRRAAGAVLRTASSPRAIIAPHTTLHNTLSVS